MKLKIVFIFSFLVLQIISCTNNNFITEKELAEKFGQNSTFIWNADSSYVLCIKNSRNQKTNSWSPLEFFIFDIKKDSVTYREVLPGGSADWLDNELIEVNILPGNISGDETEEEFYYIYNVKLNKKIKKGG